MLASPVARIFTVLNWRARSTSSTVKAGQIALSAIWNRTAAIATHRLIESFRPDVLHAHKLYPQLSVSPIVVAQKHDVPIVQTVHDYEFISASPIDHRGRRYDYDEELRTYRILNSVLFEIKRHTHVSRVTRWISVSRAVASRYMSNGPFQMETLPNFVPRESSGPISGYQTRSGVLFLGRLTSEKGVRHVVELAKRAPDLPVFIAGDGPLANEVRGADESISNLEYLGPLDSDEVQIRLRSVRVVAMPSMWQEPGPLVALEAMAAGTPIVAYASGGLAEYVRDACAGVVVPPNVDALIAAVVDMHDGPQRWSELSKCASKAIEERHSTAGYVEQLERIYVAASVGGNHDSRA
jgi:glycosyltransferase involved in cell wall biosynthesis